ncbi:MAG: winged helix family transcriptional regulator, partial [Sphingobacteriales bacterium]
PMGCYYIQLTLLPQDSGVWLSAGAVPLFLLLGLKVYRKKKTGIPEPGKAAADDCIMIGSAAYYPALQKLAISGQTIALTGKEARVLGIFAANINREVSRERLQKEVWEDEGVIVGRSLDMFISKLRKKLQGAPGIQIISIHGKGYKLVVEG